MSCVLCYCTPVGARTASGHWDCQLFESGTISFTLRTPPNNGNVIVCVEGTPYFPLDSFSDSLAVFPL